MISASVISTIFAGGKLALATAQYLDSINSKWRSDEINSKLDAIRDVHLKAGYEFLKDAALSSYESNSTNSLNLAYSEFVKAKSSYSDRSSETWDTASDASFSTYFKTNSNSVVGNLWNKGVDKFNKTSELENQCRAFEEETNNFIKSMEGLAFCHVIRGELLLAKECLISIYRIQVMNAWRLFEPLYNTLGRMFSYFPTFMIKNTIHEIHKLIETIQVLDPSYNIETLPEYKKYYTMKSICNSNKS